MSKKYDFFLHRSGGIAFDHFGGIGAPYKVSKLKYFIMVKIFGYSGTVSPKGSNLHRVMIRAAITRKISRHCIKMDDIRKGDYDWSENYTKFVKENWPKC